MILAEGFEEAEAIIVADVLKRLGLDLTLAGLETEEVTGAHDIKIDTACTLSNLDPKAFHAVILPGGMPGSMNLRNSDKAMDFTNAIYNAGGIAAAICAAPIALARYGITEGKTITSYPGFDGYLQGNKATGAMTEVDGRVVTGKGPGAAFEFASKIAGMLGKDTSELYKGMFVS
jgi:DJ-1 family protein